MQENAVVTLLTIEHSEYGGENDRDLHDYGRRPTSDGQTKPAEGADGGV